MLCLKKCLFYGKDRENEMNNRENEMNKKLGGLEYIKPPTKCIYENFI